MNEFERAASALCDRTVELQDCLRELRDAVERKAAATGRGIREQSISPRMEEALEKAAKLIGPYVA